MLRHHAVTLQPQKLQRQFSGLIRPIREQLRPADPHRTVFLIIFKILLHDLSRSAIKVQLTRLRSAKKHICNTVDQQDPTGPQCIRRRSARSIYGPAVDPQYRSANKHVKQWIRKIQLARSGSAVDPQAIICSCQRNSGSARISTGPHEIRKEPINNMGPQYTP